MPGQRVRARLVQVGGTLFFVGISGHTQLQCRSVTRANCAWTDILLYGMLFTRQMIDDLAITIDVHVYSGLVRVT